MGVKMGLETGSGAAETFYSEPDSEAEYFKACINALTFAPVGRGGHMLPPCLVFFLRVNKK